MCKYLFMISVLIISGCATKQYPIASPVSFDEANILDCKGVEQDIARVQSVQQEIEQIGEFDGQTVIGFLGDFGIGNGLAKSDARKKAQNRLNKLEVLKVSKCTSTTTDNMYSKNLKMPLSAPGSYH